MLSIKKMEVLMSLILTAGMIVSISLVLIGGTLYLLQHGSQHMHYDMMQVDYYKTNLTLIWNAAISFSPVGIIELGLITLVATQGIRVALLVGFYAAIQDYKFLLISLFIISVLIYSLFFRN